MTKPETTLIRGGTVVLGQTVSQQDVLIQGERIAAVGNLSDYKADVTLDAGGLLVLPGAVDTHVHFNDVFMNTISVHDYYTGTLAAAYGGVTTVVDFSNQKHGEPLIDTLRYKREEAGNLPLVDWGVHPCITDPTPETLDQIPLVVAEGAPSIKCYMTYREDGLYVSPEDLKRIAQSLRKAGGMLLVHAEDDETIAKNISDLINAGLTDYVYHTKSKPPESENKAIRQCIEIARETGCRVFVVHMASADGAELGGAARAEGVDVIAETCTHYLVFTEDMLERDDGLKWICSPPLRDQENQDRLWAALRDGRISMVTSDDAAYSWEAKLYGVDRFDKCPNGIPGIEPRLSLLYSEGVAKGRLSLPRFVEVVAGTPAQLFGLAPQKGSLLPEWKPLFAGMELADSVSWDPHKQFRVPIPSSVLFVRRREDFYRMALHGDYFNRPEDVEPNPGLKSAPTTRPFSALPLVTSLRHQGMAQVLQRLRAPLAAIKSLADYIESQADLELLHQPDIGILCFRITPEGFPEEQLSQLQRYVYDRIMAGGERTVSMTKLDGKTALRLVAISPYWAGETLIETVKVVQSLASEYH